MSTKVQKRAKDALYGNQTGINDEIEKPLQAAGSALDPYHGTPVDYLGKPKHIINLQKQKSLLKDLSVDPSQQTYALNVTPDMVKEWDSIQKAKDLQDFELYAGRRYLEGASPAEAKWFSEVLPEVFEARIAEFDHILQMQKKLAILKLVGPRSKEDVYLKYAYEKDTDGFFKRYGKAIWLLDYQADSATPYRRGVLNFLNGPSAMIGKTQTINQLGPHTYKNNWDKTGLGTQNAGPNYFRVR